jgi:hypothetical protein
MFGFFSTALFKTILIIRRIQQDIVLNVKYVLM